MVGRRIGSPLLVGALALGLMGLAPGAAQAAPTTSIAGTVHTTPGGPGYQWSEVLYQAVECDETDPDDSQGYVVHASTVLVEDEDGSFSFPAYAGECYLVALHYDNAYLPLSSQGETVDFVSIPAGTTDVDLVPAARPEDNLTVTVPGMGDGDLQLLQWFAGGWVEAGSGQGDGEGNFSFRTVPGGTYTLYLSSGGDYYPQALDGTLDYPGGKDKEETKTFTAPAPGQSLEMTFRAREGSAVTGTISANRVTTMPQIFALEWDPVWGVVGQIEGVIDADGTYRIGGLVPGHAYTVAAIATGYLPAWLGGYVGGSPGEGDVKTFLAPAGGKTLTGRDITLGTRAATVGGAVAGFDACDADGAWVTATNVLTGEGVSGYVYGQKYTVEGLGAGLYEIEVGCSAADDGGLIFGGAFDVKVATGAKATQDVEGRPTGTDLWSAWPMVTVQGVARVGTVLKGTTSITGVATPASKITWRYYWSDGTTLFGRSANLLVPAAAKGAKDLHLIAFATAAGQAPAWNGWRADGTPVGAGEAPHLRRVPVVTGRATVGATLTVSTGTWTPTVTRYAYQWLRNGKPIAGATHATYTPVAADAGHRLSVRITPLLAGHAAVPVVTASTAKVAPGPGVTVKASASGRAAVGAKLSARGAPAGWKVTYQWLRGGKPIAKATHRTYTLRAADAGTRVSVRLTAKRTGYTTSVGTSAARTVAKVTPTVRVKPAGAKARATVVVTVSAKGCANPTGKVTVRVAGKSRTVALKRAGKGEVRVVFPDLKAGKHAVRVTYSGTSHIASRTATASVTVR